MRMLASSILLFGFVGAANAATVVVDFESGFSCVTFPLDCSQAGLNVRSEFRYLDDAALTGPSLDGSIGLSLLSTSGGFALPAILLITAENGLPFDLLSIDVAGHVERVSGFNEGGDFISVETGVNRSSSPPLPWQTIAFDSRFKDMTYVRVVSTAEDPRIVMFDNIVANVVPIPAAVWLFGSALLGLGWIRRKGMAAGGGVASA